MPGVLLKLLVKDKLLRSGKVPVNAAADTPEERKTRLQQVRDRLAASHELPSPQDVDPIVAMSNLYDFTLCSIKIFMQKLIMKMSLLVDHRKAQSLPFQTKFVSKPSHCPSKQNLFRANRASISGVMR